MEKPIRELIKICFKEELMRYGDFQEGKLPERSADEADRYSGWTGPGFAGVDHFPIEDSGVFVVGTYFSDDLIEEVDFQKRSVVLRSGFSIVEEDERAIELRFQAEDGETRIGMSVLKESMKSVEIIKRQGEAKPYLRTDLALLQIAVAQNVLSRARAFILEEDTQGVSTSYGALWLPAKDLFAPDVELFGEKKFQKNKVVFHWVLLEAVKAESFVQELLKMKIIPQRERWLSRRHPTASEVKKFHST